MSLVASPRVLHPSQPTPPPPLSLSLTLAPSPASSQWHRAGDASAATTPSARGMHAAGAHYEKRTSRMKPQTRRLSIQVAHTLPPAAALAQVTAAAPSSARPAYSSDGAAGAEQGDDAYGSVHDGAVPYDPHAPTAEQLRQQAAHPPPRPPSPTLEEVLAGEAALRARLGGGDALSHARQSVAHAVQVRAADTRMGADQTPQLAAPFSTPTALDLFSAAAAATSDGASNIPFALEPQYAPRVRENANPMWDVPRPASCDGTGFGPGSSRAEALARVARERSVSPTRLRSHVGGGVAPDLSASELALDELQDAQGDRWLSTALAQQKAAFHASIPPTLLVRLSALQGEFNSREPDRHFLDAIEGGRMEQQVRHYDVLRGNPEQDMDSGGGATAAAAAHVLRLGGHYSRPGTAGSTAATAAAARPHKAHRGSSRSAAARPTSQQQQQQQQQPPPVSHLHSDAEVQSVTTKAASIASQSVRVTPAPKHPPTLPATAEGEVASSSVLDHFPPPPPPSSAHTNPMHTPPYAADAPAAPSQTISPSSPSAPVPRSADARLLSTIFDAHSDEQQGESKSNDTAGAGGPPSATAASPPPGPVRLGSHHRPSGSMSSRGKHRVTPVSSHRSPSPSSRATATALGAAAPGTWANPVPRPPEASLLDYVDEQLVRRQQQQQQQQQHLSSHSHTTGAMHARHMSVEERAVAKGFEVPVLLPEQEEEEGSAMQVKKKHRGSAPTPATSMRPRPPSPRTTAAGSSTARVRSAASTRPGSGVAGRGSLSARSSVVRPRSSTATATATATTTVGLDVSSGLSSFGYGERPCLADDINSQLRGGAGSDTGRVPMDVMARPRSSATNRASGVHYASPHKKIISAAYEQLEAKVSDTLVQGSLRLLDAEAFRREVGYITGAGAPRSGGGQKKGGGGAGVASLLSESAPLARVQYLREQALARRAADEAAFAQGLGTRDLSLSRGGGRQARAAVSLSLHPRWGDQADTSGGGGSGDGDDDLQIAAKWTKLRGTDVAPIAAHSFGEPPSHDPFRATASTASSAARDGSGRPAAFDPSKYLGPGSYDVRDSLVVQGPGAHGRTAVYYGPPHSAFVAPEPPAPASTAADATARAALAREGGPGSYTPSTRMLGHFLGKHTPGAVDLRRSSGRRGELMSWRGARAPPLSNPGVAEYDIAKHGALWADTLKHRYSEHTFGRGGRFALAGPQQPQPRSLDPSKLLALCSPRTGAGAGTGAAASAGGSTAGSGLQLQTVHLVGAVGSSSGRRASYDRNVDAFMHSMGIPPLEDVAHFLSKDEMAAGAGVGGAFAEGDGGGGKEEGDGIAHPPPPHPPHPKHSRGHGSIVGLVGEGPSGSGLHGGGGGGFGAAAMLRGGLSRELENLLSQALATTPPVAVPASQKKFVPILVAPNTNAGAAARSTGMAPTHSRTGSIGGSGALSPRSPRGASFSAPLSPRSIIGMSTVTSSFDLDAVAAASALDTSSPPVSAPPLLPVLPEQFSAASSSAPSTFEQLARAALLGTPSSSSRTHRGVKKKGVPHTHRASAAASAAASTAPAASSSSSEKNVDAHRALVVQRAREHFEQRQRILREKLAAEEAWSAAGARGPPGSHGAAAAVAAAGTGKLFVQRWLALQSLMRSLRFFHSLLNFSRRIRSPSNRRVRAARVIQRAWRGFWARLRARRRLAALGTLNRVFGLFRMKLRIRRKKKAASLLRTFLKQMAMANMQPALKVRLKHGAAMASSAPEEEGVPVSGGDGVAAAPASSSSSSSSMQPFSVAAPSISSLRQSRDREKRRQQNQFVARLKSQGGGGSSGGGERTLVSLIRHFKNQVVRIQRAWRSYCMMREFQIDMHVLLWDQIVLEHTQQQGVRQTVHAQREASAAAAGASSSGLPAAALFISSSLSKPSESSKAFRDKAAALRAEKEAQRMEQAARERDRAEASKFGIETPDESHAHVAAAADTPKRISSPALMSRTSSVTSSKSTAADEALSAGSSSPRPGSPAPSPPAVARRMSAPKPPKPLVLKLESRFTVADKKAVLLQALRHRKLRFLHVKRHWEHQRDRWLADQCEGVAAARRLLEIDTPSENDGGATAASATSTGPRSPTNGLVDQFVARSPPPYLPRLMSQRQMVALMNAASQARRDTRKTRYHTAALQARLGDGMTPAIGAAAAAAAWQQGGAVAGSSHAAAAGASGSNDAVLGKSVRMLFTPPAPVRTPGGTGTVSPQPGGSPRSSTGNLLRTPPQLLRRSSIPLAAPPSPSGSGSRSPRMSVSPRGSLVVPAAGAAHSTGGAATTAAHLHHSDAHTEAGLRDALLKAWAAQLPMPTRKPTPRVLTDEEADRRNWGERGSADPTPPSSSASASRTRRLTRRSSHFVPSSSSPAPPAASSRAVSRVQSRTLDGQSSPAGSASPRHLSPVTRVRQLATER